MSQQSSTPTQTRIDDDPSVAVGLSATEGLRRVSADVEPGTKSDREDNPVQEAVDAGSTWFSDVMERRRRLTRDDFELGLKLFGAITVVLAGLQYLNSVRR